jgi:hypothetical protein
LRLAPSRARHDVSGEYFALRVSVLSATPLTYSRFHDLSQSQSGSQGADGRDGNRAQNTESPRPAVRFRGRRNGIRSGPHLHARRSRKRVPTCDTQAAVNAPMGPAFREVGLSIISSSSKSDSMKSSVSHTGAGPLSQAMSTPSSRGNTAMEGGALRDGVVGAPAASRAFGGRYSAWRHHPAGGLGHLTKASPDRRGHPSGNGTQLFCWGGAVAPRR